MNEGSSRSHAIFTVTIDQKLSHIIEPTDDPSIANNGAPMAPET
jgi:hypothetical protein